MLSDLFPHYLKASTTNCIEKRLLFLGKPRLLRAKVRRGNMRSTLSVVDCLQLIRILKVVIAGITHTIIGNSQATFNDALNNYHK
jgi:hypothetical protein